MADVTVTPIKQTEKDNKEKWSKLGVKMQTFLHLLTKNHPIARMLVDGIDNSIQKKQKEQKKPMTAEEKYKTAFDALASSNPEERQAIKKTAEAIPLASKSKAVQAKTDLALRAKALFKTQDDCFARKESKTMLSGFKAHKHSSTEISELVGVKLGSDKGSSIASDQDIARKRPILTPN